MIDKRSRDRYFSEHGNKDLINSFAQEIQKLDKTDSLLDPLKKASKASNDSVNISAFTLATMQNMLKTMIAIAKESPSVDDIKELSSSIKEIHIPDNMESYEIISREVLKRMNLQIKIQLATLKILTKIGKGLKK